jgi:hypothetical protein
MYVDPTRAITNDCVNRPRFILVNNRVPCGGESCAGCGDVIESGYVRDSRTGLVYCDMQCITVGRDIAMLVNEVHGRKVS